MAAARLGFDLGNTKLLVQAATEHQGLSLEGPGPSSKGKSKAQQQVEEYNVTDQATAWKEIMALQKGQYGGTDPLLIVSQFSSSMSRVNCDHESEYHGIAGSSPMVRLAPFLVL